VVVDHCHTNISQICLLASFAAYPKALHLDGENYMEYIHNVGIAAPPLVGGKTVTVSETLF